MTSDILQPRNKSTIERSGRNNMAFIMEVLILIIFLMISTTIIMQVFGVAKQQSDDASDLSLSVLLAANEAERFYINPSAESFQYYTLDHQGNIIEASESSSSSFLVSRYVESQREDGGILYHATIKVERLEKVIFEISSSRYVQSTVFT